MSPASVHSAGGAERGRSDGRSERHRPAAGGGDAAVNGVRVTGSPAVLYSVTQRGGSHRLAATT